MELAFQIYPPHDHGSAVHAAEAGAVPPEAVVSTPRFNSLLPGSSLQRANSPLPLSNMLPVISTLQ